MAEEFSDFRIFTPRSHDKHTSNMAVYHYVQFSYITTPHVLVLYSVIWMSATGKQGLNEDAHNVLIIGTRQTAI